MWGRGFLNAIARNASNDVARQHVDQYGYGTGDQDITVLRLGENLESSGAPSEPHEGTVG